MKATNCWSCYFIAMMWMLWAYFGPEKEVASLSQATHMIYDGMLFIGATLLFVLTYTAEPKETK